MVLYCRFICFSFLVVARRTSLEERRRGERKKMRAQRGAGEQERHRREEGGRAQYYSLQPGCSTTLPVAGDAKSVTGPQYLLVDTFGRNVQENNAPIMTRTVVLDVTRVGTVNP
jgi:hypothetical protein